MDQKKKKTTSIFIVEDDFFQAVILDKILTSLGYNVIGKTTSGEEAIQLAIQLNPDIIFMDISLDGSVNGITAAKKIQDQISTNLIYVTGNSDQYHRDKANDTDFKDYLIKPITRGIIEETLNRLGL